ncbi:HAMP domain-containing sensor histidine kinase [Clostridium sp. chh4-2]|uniref:sensor histidine kinase n=1 Tax=Clostridium sp. chh4-2 TaxID=2067550 RepID=UPI0011AFCB7E|nr:HAMP domain-containing sensor histidine kinase [Clostridium sp. chh4-2]
MDTKLKNRHSLGILLMIVTIIVAAASMIGMYPYIEKNAAAYEAGRKKSGEYEVNQAREFSVEFMNSSYAIWQEYIQDQAGYIMTPAQVFYPQVADSLMKENVQDTNIQQDTNTVEAEDGSYSEEDTAQMETAVDVSEYLRDFQYSINERGEIWKSHYRQLRPKMSYRMLDENGKELMSNKGSDFDPLKGTITVQMKFDNLGRLLVERVQADTSVYQEQIANTIGDSLGNYYFYDPMAAVYQDYYSGVAIPNFSFSGPKNVTYEFTVNQSAVIPDNQSYSQWSRILPYYHDHTILYTALAIMGLVTLLALFFPCFRSFQIGQEKIFRAPLELVLLIASVCISIFFSTLPAQIVGMTLTGAFREELIRADFLPGAANFLVWLINFGAWAIGFGLLYWGITCMRSVFVIGPVRYFKERTLTGRILRWLWKHWIKFVKCMTTIDWSSTSTKQIGKLVLVNGILLIIINCFWFFGIPAILIYSAVLFFWLRKYYNDMQKKYGILLESISQIADGDLNIRIEEDLGVFEPIKEELSVIQDGFKNAVNKEMVSQHMKTELITNVSHDLKTPLTAIITYVNLLQQEDVTEEEKKNYIEVLEQKSMRLKALIEDLFDISKATSRNMPLNLVDVDLVNLIKQVRLELSDRIETSGIDFRWKLPEEKVILTLDSQKTYRIFENLLVNITKYALPGTRAYVELTEDEWVTVTLRNISATEITVTPQELMERFVRGDESRNTEGSGLGMAIAKSFVEVQGGEMDVEIEADLFRVTVRWRNQNFRR